MKYFLKNAPLFLTIIFLFSGFTNSSRLFRIQENDPGVDSFLSAFYSAVKNHNTARVMGLMDDAYRMEQHDKFHKGNTKRFLDELFCGKIITEEKFKCVKFQKVKDIETVSKGEGEKEVAVVMRVTEKKVKVDVYLTIRIVIKNGVKQYGIVGGVG